MDIKQLEAFVNVVDSGSFSKAAKLLHVTQPTISVHIATLEGEMGCKLIGRLPSESALTETGKALYGYAKEILVLRDKALTMCKKPSADAQGTIHIAASSIPYQYVLPVLISEFHLKYPLAQFEVGSYDSAAVATQVLDGSADIGMTGAVVEDDALLYDAFMEDALVVVIPQTAPFENVGQNGLSLDELVQLPFILRGPGSGTRIETEAYLNENGIEVDALNAVAQMDNTDAIIKAVSQGLGISIVSQLSASDYERFGTIRISRLQGSRILRKLYLVRRKNSPLPTLADAFVRFATRNMPQP
ncbi:MAG: selenium metabolism-associated LysR family transcriptional regulator [Oscillospiraceae bacterium]